jgi:1,4-dihydroxy-6-naphthoate synthase
VTSRTLRVGLSPCPNDTFILHALLEGLVSAAGLGFEPVIDDVEKLNQLARRGVLEVTKLSFHAYGQVRERYEILDAGAALGRGCGPLLVCRAGETDRDSAALRIAIPGRWTTAALLLRLWEPRLDPAQLVEVPFDRIVRGVARGDFDAGLIIHESRFTFAEHGLVAKVDLGAWWEVVHGHPIPLGGIAARRDLGEATIRAVEGAVRESVRHAIAHPDDSRAFVRRHAQELAGEVIEAHIALYVTPWSVSLGEEGRRAVEHLLEVAESAGFIPSPEAPPSPQGCTPGRRSRRTSR